MVTDNKGAKTSDTISIKVKRAFKAKGHYTRCNVELAHSVLETYQKTMNFGSKIVLKEWLCSTPSLEGDALEKKVSDIFS